MASIFDRASGSHHVKELRRRHQPNIRVNRFPSCAVTGYKKERVFYFLVV